MSRRFDPDDPELMDRPQPVTPELERDLANLRTLNRRFGAYRIIDHVLRPHLREGASLRIVDFCTGSGDLPVYVANAARESGARVEIDAVDFNASTLAIAREYCRDYPEIRLHHGDARTWAPDGRSPDWVLCSLALHHFARSDAVRLLQRMRSLAVRGALAADLERAPWVLAGIFAASLFFREAMTVHDMRKSARAAFSFNELAAMAAEAGWPRFRSHRRFFYGRQAIWYENTAPARPGEVGDPGPLPVPA